MSKYFGTDGFRGEAGITLTADHAYKVGRFLGWYYNALRERNGDTDPARIVIGKDCFLASNFPHFHRYDSLKSALYIHAVSKNINTFPKNQGSIRAAIAVKILDFTVMYR